METYIPNKHELIEAIQQAVRKGINEAVPNIVRRATQKEYLTKQELMSLTGYSSRTIQHLRDTRQIPYSQHGRKIVYPYKGILEYLDRNNVEAVR